MQVSLNLAAHAVVLLRLRVGAVSACVRMGVPSKQGFIN